jgi:hypothetical protein
VILIGERVAVIGENDEAGDVAAIEDGGRPAIDVDGEEIASGDVSRIDDGGGAVFAESRDAHEVSKDGATVLDGDRAA